MSDDLPPPPYAHGEPETLDGPGSAETGNRQGVLIGVGIAALVLLAGAAGLFVTLNRGNDPEGVVERFLKAYDNEQCDKAFDLWELGEVGRDDFIEQCEGTDAEFDIVAFEVTRVEAEPDFDAPAGADDTAVVHIRIELEGEEPSDGSFSVARFDGEWKLVVTERITG